MRRILEAHAAGVAATRASDDDIAAMDAEITGVDEGVGIEELVKHDTRFHRALVAASGNRYLSSLVESLSSQTVRARVWRGLTEDGAVVRTLQEHRGILDAVRSGDVGLATALVTAHISGVEHWLERARTDS